MSRFRIAAVSRGGQSAGTEELAFDPGVNVVVGIKDTGKTTWLRILSFLLGDARTPRQALGRPIEQGFDWVSARLILETGEELLLQRSWRKRDLASKISVGEELIEASEFSAWFARQLRIPEVTFPKGDPLVTDTWLALSWRMLFSHVLRDEDHWTEVVADQSPSEQLACQLQFLGVATRVYPKEEADELQTKRNLLRAKARLDEFRRTTLEGAQSLVPDLVAETSERSVGARLDEAIELFQRQLKELENSRNQASKKALTRQKYELEPLAKQRVAVVAALEKAHVSANDLAIRKNQLSEYRTNVTNEVAKLERAAVSSEVFSPLSVRSCPYCDQAVDPERAIVGSCFVCCQALPSGFQTSASGAKSRIGFEQQQLRAELTELQDLLGKLDKEHDTAERHVRKLKKELDVLEASLQPARDVFTALLPTGTLAINTRIGELRERLLHLRELRVNLSREDELEKDVQQLEGLLQTHSARPASSQVSRSEQAGRLSQGINEYLESLNADDPTRWIQGRVDIELSDRSPVLTIGGRPLSALGATSRILVLLGYHYALLKICKTQPSNYPGIALLDFPPTLADGETVAGQENYLVKPFISLCRGEKFLQLIVCGRVFEDLEGVRRIPLTEVWQSLEIQPGTPDKLPEESGSDGVLLRVGVVYHTGRTQIVVVLDHANTRRLGSVIPALGRHIEEGKTWKGNAILARWGGGEFEAKLGYNKDNKNAKFTIKKRAAPELWYYLDNKLRHATSRVDYSARFEVGGPGKLDVFQVNVSVPPRSSRKRSSR